MTRAIWTLRQAASDDIDEIIRYIAPNDPQVARRFVDAIQGAFDLLYHYPRAGARRPGRRPQLTHLRCWPVGGRFRQYVILYLPHDDGVEIVRVLHGARDVDGLMSHES